MADVITIHRGERCACSNCGNQQWEVFVIQRDGETLLAIEKIRCTKCKMDVFLKFDR